MNAHLTIPTRGRCAALALCSALAACGGGSSDSGTGSPTAPAGAVAPLSGTGLAAQPAAGTPTTPVSQSTTPNVLPVRVAATPTTTRNLLTTSVTVCAPGTDRCASVDNVQVDTGSQGLRLLASALPAGLALPDATAPDAAGRAATGECAVFGTGYTWGAVRLADVKLAGEVAQALPIQLIADPSVPAVPGDCAGAGLAMNDPVSLRANGILGIGLFNADCGTSCANQALPRWYYACDAEGRCSSSAQPLARQVSNPVAAFGADNNGVVIDLPAVSDAGGATVSGALIFGIGTQANNALGGATVLRANPSNGFVTTTTADGTVYSQSYLDSGSNGLFFWSTALPRCGAWFCPDAPQQLAATLQGADGATAGATFRVTNAQSLFATGNWAFSNLAGYNGNMFGWGLPFFFGRRVYTAIEAQATPAGAGPYYAF